MRRVRALLCAGAMLIPPMSPREALGGARAGGARLFGWFSCCFPHNVYVLGLPFSSHTTVRHLRGPQHVHVAEPASGRDRRQGQSMFTPVWRECQFSANNVTMPTDQKNTHNSVFFMMENMVPTTRARMRSKNAHNSVFFMMENMAPTTRASTRSKNAHNSVFYDGKNRCP